MHVRPGVQVDMLRGHTQMDCCTAALLPSPVSFVTAHILTSVLLHCCTAALACIFCHGPHIDQCTAALLHCCPRLCLLPCVQAVADAELISRAVEQAQLFCKGEVDKVRGTLPHPAAVIMPIQRLLFCCAVGTRHEVEESQTRACCGVLRSPQVQKVADASARRVEDVLQAAREASERWKALLRQHQQLEKEVRAPEQLFGWHV
jgi:hypothetical protein